MIRKFLLKCNLNINKYDPFEFFSSLSADFDPEKERCPYCNSLGQCRPHGSYERGVTDLSCGHEVYQRIKVKRLICSSCGHTHGIIPDNIVPYRWYSLPFILHILHLYLSESMKIPALCDLYGFSHSTLYRWLTVLSEHKLWWLGALLADQTALLAFLDMVFNLTSCAEFTLGFFRKTLYSFLQSHINPANCRHMPPGWLPSGEPQHETGISSLSGTG